MGGRVAGSRRRLATTASGWPAAGGQSTMDAAGLRFRRRGREVRRAAIGRLVAGCHLATVLCTWVSNEETVQGGPMR